MTVLLPLALSVLVAIVAPCVGRVRAGLAAPTAVAGSVLIAVALAFSLAGGGGAVDVAWLPAWGWRLHLALDALGGLYAALAAGIAVPVLVYAWAYLPHHLEETGASPRREPLFYGWMLAFLASMLGLALAADLILLFVFFDLTALCSWALIGFDREDAESRSAALCALLVTAVSSLGFLVGLLLLHARHGTLQIDALGGLAAADATTIAAFALVLVAALAKSAQVPLHFWLPRAMAAPTPVSAYLHSAAMVAAGVFVMHRLHAALPDAVLLALSSAGWASVLVGGLLALVADDLKRILAWSTIAQYGHVAVILGAGGADAAAAAAVYVAVHAVAKSALFLAAGAVTHATGQRRLSQVGGLRRRLPVLAAATAVAAAAVAGLPGTAGFFKDEAFFQVVAGERGGLAGGAAVAAVTLSLAYMARFWGRIFLGASRGAQHAVPRRLALPVVALALLLLVAGFGGASLAQLGRSAAAAVHAAGPRLELAYHLDLRASNAMALAGWMGGMLLLASRSWWEAPVRVALARASAFGPSRLWDAGLHGLEVLSDRMHWIEVRDLRDRIASVLAPAGVLSAAALLAGREAMHFEVGGGPAARLPLAVALVATAAATLSVMAVRSHLGMVVMLTGVGFALAAVFAVLGAPDVALVAVLVETGLTLLFVVVLGTLPQRRIDREEGVAPPRLRTRWHAGAALLSGVVALAVTWAALSSPASPTVAARLVDLAPRAHAQNVVSAVLADFRGLDTLGEASVLVVAMLGLLALLDRRVSR